MAFTTKERLEIKLHFMFLRLIFVIMIEKASTSVFAILLTRSVNAPSCSRKKLRWPCAPLLCGRPCRVCDSVRST